MVLLFRSCFEALIMETNFIESGILVPCCHRLEKLNDPTILKCEYRINQDGSCWHIIYLRDMVKKMVAMKRDLTRLHHNDRGAMHKFEERLTAPPLMRFYNLPLESSNDIVGKCVDYIVNVFLSFTICNFSHDYLMSKEIRDKGASFLQTLVVMADGNMSFTHKYLTTQCFRPKTKQKQLTEIFTVLKTFLFSKKRSGTGSKVPVTACNKCKLSGFTERFILYDYTKIHTVLCVEKSPSDHERLELLEHFMLGNFEMLPKALGVLTLLPQSEA